MSKFKLTPQILSIVLRLKQEQCGIDFGVFQLV